MDLATGCEQPLSDVPIDSTFEYGDWHALHALPAAAVGTGAGKTSNDTGAQRVCAELPYAAERRATRALAIPPQDMCTAVRGVTGPSLSTCPAIPGNQLPVCSEEMALCSLTRPLERRGQYKLWVGSRDAPAWRSCRYGGQRS